MRLGKGGRGGSGDQDGWRMAARAGQGGGPGAVGAAARRCSRVATNQASVGARRPVAARVRAMVRARAQWPAASAAWSGICLSRSASFQCETIRSRCSFALPGSAAAVPQFYGPHCKLGVYSSDRRLRAEHRRDSQLNCLIVIDQGGQTVAAQCRISQLLCQNLLVQGLARLVLHWNLPCLGDLKLP